MKHLFLSAAIFGIVLTSMTFYAAAPVKVTFEDGKFALQDEYTQIEVTALPIAITEAVSNDYPGATIAKAYVNEAKTYKLILTKEGAMATVYADETGQWITK
ncbi:hypothetical protein [uncultured Formosa sp.]|uniref:hypothetical protein n=1 Tax=uncultured Formosa sp. TaxID=255435 RepID=UPI00260BF0DA|nr:hypothetical protein [uncultured Formosa sp.]